MSDEEKAEKIIVEFLQKKIAQMDETLSMVI